MSDQLELLPLIHQPLPPYPRQGMVPECIYAAEWAKLMTEKQSILWDDEHGHGLARVLPYLPGELTQRDASLAASFICWLGTHVGNAFLAQAIDGTFNRRGSERMDATLCAWVLENKRISWINRGVRTIEHWLADARMELTARDLEVAECVAYWLGSDAAEHFLLQCERQIGPKDSRVIRAIERVRKAEEVFTIVSKGAAA